jgi:short-subunit dehydrogenase
MTDGLVVVVGGTQGLGKEVARHYADEGRTVVVTGRDVARAGEVAGELGGRTSGVAFDLAEPESIAPSRARSAWLPSSSSATRRSSTRCSRTSTTGPRS